MSSVLTLVFFGLLIGLVIALALTSLYLKKKQRQLAEGLYYDSEQGPIFYKVDGEKGPWVALIHGLGASTYCWRNVTPELSKQYRVLSFDLWGFGNSSKSLKNDMNLDSQVQTIQDLINSLSIESFNVIGHSMGGEMALWLKRIDPRVQKCIAITPAAHPSLVSALLHKFSWLANWTPLLLTEKTISKILIRVLAKSSIVSEEMISSYYHPYRDPKAHVSFAAAFKVIRDPRVFEALPKLGDNIYVIWAAKDEVINRKVVKMVSERLHAKVSITHPWSGHMPMEDDPDWLNVQLKKCLSD